MKTKRLKSTSHWYLPYASTLIFLVGAGNTFAQFAPGDATAIPKPGACGMAVGGFAILITFNILTHRRKRVLTPKQSSRGKTGVQAAGVAAINRPPAQQ